MTTNGTIPRIVDVHAHVWDAHETIVLNPVRESRGARYAKAVEEALQGKQRDELSTRIAALDAAGIDLQVLSVTYPHAKGVVVDAAFCSRANSMLAEFVADAPDRLRGFAKLDMSDASGAIAELERSVRQLGLLGAFLTTDFELDNPEYEDFYSAVEDLGVPMFLHGVMPGGFLQDSRLAYREDRNGSPFSGRYNLGAPWAFMYEETLAAFVVMLSGILDRHPRLNVCICHGGGALAFAAPRLSASLATHDGSAAHMSDPDDFAIRLRRLWVDSDVQSSRNLQLVLDVLNPDQVVLGTDFPGWAASPLERYSEEMQERLSRNALNLLNIKAPSAAN